MMRALYLGSTGVFWCAAAVIWAASLWWDAGDTQRAKSGDGRYRLDEIARHDRAADCWMAIDGAVYDLTGYLPQHPTKPEVIVPYCGKDATFAYGTKNRSRPHSSYADGLLRSYRIGTVAK
jgi:cytochrome b involved in lipid metabolism